MITSIDTLGGMLQSYLIECEFLFDRMHDELLDAVLDPPHAVHDPRRLG